MDYEIEDDVGDTGYRVEKYDLVGDVSLRGSKPTSFQKYKMII
ncbi:hypothetical protein [Mammaliicoccus sp. I-M35]|nr:hypothetical protein [Mammaliicoccus sp. I-M35]